MATFFEERVSEVDDYLDLLRAIEREAANGVPRLEATKTPITVTQQKVLSSTVYLQLYNITEAIVSRCIESLAKAFSVGKWHPGDLADDLRREWVRHIARTHVDMSPEKRLTSAMALCEHLLSSLPLGEFEVEAGGGGNWDDEEIYRLSARLGCELQIAVTTTAAVKRPIRDNLGALKLVRDRRNGLAHGSLSFQDCADGVDVEELTRTAAAVRGYLKEVIASFGVFIDSYLFLVETKRPLVAKK